MDAAPITRRVVVALDGSDASFAALRWALAELDSAHDVLRILVIETPRVSRAQVEAGLVQERLGGTTLADAVRWTRTAADRPHAIGRALVDHLRSTDLLVLGSDRPGLLERLVDTSLPLYVAAITRSPVAIVPLQPPGSTRVALLVGENDAGDAPLRFAMREARRRRTGLTLLHAWQVAPGYPPELAASSAGWEHARREAQQVLDAGTARARALDPELPVEERLVEGPRLRALQPELDGAALAVVGRRGSGVLRDVVLGSLAHDLVSTLPCPLAIIPLSDDRG